MSQPAEHEPPIVLFDGHCNFCSSAVQFIIRRDPRGRLRFASIGSDAARAALERAEFPCQLPDSVVLIDRGQVHTLSSAGLRIARYLRMAWPLLSLLLIVPKPLRDTPYRWVARNRYRWFGRREECMIPTPDVRARFLS